MTARPVRLVAGVAGVALVSLAWGDRGFAPQDLAGYLQGEVAAMMIVGDVRAPRTAVAALVGACLAVAGAITQAVMRNPLAEPGLLGITGGASLGVTVLLVTVAGPIGHLMPLAGFAGAGLMAAAIYLLAWRGGTSSIRLILIGIGLGALAGAGTSFLTAFGDVRDVERAVAWAAGGVYGATWTEVVWAAAWATPVFAAVRLLARELDLLGFDDACAGSLGLRIHLARGGLLLLCTLLAGIAVAVAGPVGFIGLVAPHLARRSSPRHADLLWTTALWGSLLMLVADILGRLAQLPSGLLTPLVGVPFIGLLLWRRRND